MRMAVLVCAAMYRMRDRHTSITGPMSGNKRMHSLPLVQQYNYYCRKISANTRMIPIEYRQNP